MPAKRILLLNRRNDILATMLAKIWFPLCCSFLAKMRRMAQSAMDLWAVLSTHDRNDGGFVYIQRDDVESEGILELSEQL